MNEENILQQLLARVAGLETRIEQQGSRIEQLEAENSTLKATVQQQGSRIEQLEAENSALKAKNSRLEAENSTLKATVQQQGSRIKQLEATNLRNESRIQEQASRIQYLEAANRRHTSRIKELEATNRRNESRIKELEATVEEQDRLIVELDNTWKNYRENHDSRLEYLGIKLNKVSKYAKDSYGELKGYVETIAEGQMVNLIKEVYKDVTGALPGTLNKGLNEYACNKRNELCHSIYQADDRNMSTFWEIVKEMKKRKLWPLRSTKTTEIRKRLTTILKVKGEKLLFPESPTKLITTPERPKLGDISNYWTPKHCYITNNSTSKTC